MRRILLVATLGALALGVLLTTRFAVDQTRASDDDPTPAPTVTDTPPTISPEDLERMRAELQRAADEDKLKPRFFGPLGEFVVVPPNEHFGEGLPCAPDPSRPESSELLPSELNVPDTQQQLVCADGTVVRVYGGRVARAYFIGQPRVPADAPKERLVLTDVDGRPALAIRAVNEGFGWILYVVQREPDGRTPGIVVNVEAFEGGLEAAREAARSILSLEP